MQTAIITLSGILFLSIIGHFIQSVRARVLLRKIQRKEGQLLRYRADKADRNAVYVPGFIEGGVCAVKRLTSYDGKLMETVIKTFDTEDPQYNANMAQECTDKLNEKICYN